MRNIKKWLGIVAAGVMCFALGMTAVAAPSPSTGGIVQEITASTDANGNAVDVEIVELTEEGKAAAQQLDEAAFVKELVGADFVEGMKVLEDTLLKRLRSSDIICRYSVNQFLVMLPACQYEDAKMVVNRLKDSFYKSGKTNKLLLQYSIDELNVD